ncbi:MAG: PHP domain-containing protein [Deltaproteobacteria bacterium]|nr:PHP domain-containing protein [Deltaproteobacteria bacterium]
MPLFRADLHVHTCLSPCGDLEMSPRGVVEAAANASLDIIAICDHNSAENVAATRRAAARSGGRLKVLCGLEVCSVEEIHILALFEEINQSLAMQTLVYDHLPPRTNRPEIFGDQIIANEDDEVEGFNDRLLITATNLDLNAVVAAIHQLNGLAVASHVDRETFGLLGQLGFLPPDLQADGLEISSLSPIDRFLTTHPNLIDWPMIRGSDAHYFPDLGAAWTEFFMERPELSEIALALQHRAGRKILRLRLSSDKD